MSNFAPMDATAPAHLVFLIYGETGSGKTRAALTLAAGLTNGGRVAVISSEPKGLIWNQGITPFDVSYVEPPFSEKKLLTLMHEAEEAGYEAIVTDCLSDWYDGPGGMQDYKAQLDSQNPKGSFANFRFIADICNKINREAMFSGRHVIFTCFAREGVKQLPDKTIIDTFGPRIKKQIPERVDLVIVTEKLSEHGKPDRYIAWFDKNRIGAPVIQHDLSPEYAAKLREFLQGAAPTVKHARETTPMTFTALSGRPEEKLGAYRLKCGNEILLLLNCREEDSPVTPCTVEAQAQPFLHNGKQLTVQSDGKQLPVFQAHEWKVLA